MARSSRSRWSEIRSLFVEAHGGTLFLDEIAEMPLAVQPKLLRVLQDHEVRPLGANKVERVDVRILAATNRDLAQMISNRTFRSDLFYRVNVIQLHVPALRERRDDIPVLVGHFLEKSSTQCKKKVKNVDTEAMRALMDYSFPGNVRELENLIEGAVNRSSGESLTLADFQSGIATALSGTPRVSGHGGKGFPVQITGSVQLRHVLWETAANSPDALETMGRLLKWVSAVRRRTEVTDRWPRLWCCVLGEMALWEAFSSEVRGEAKEWVADWTATLARKPDRNVQTFLNALKKGKGGGGFDIESLARFIRALLAEVPIVPGAE